MESLQVFAIGSSVLLDGAISARVTKITILEGRVLYDCVWWNERNRQEATVEAWEIQPDGEQARMMRVDPVL